MTLDAAAAMRNWPTVPTTSPRVSRASFSASRMTSALPASASRRNAIGTVPAWPASPEEFDIGR